MVLLLNRIGLAVKQSTVSRSMSRPAGERIRSEIGISARSSYIGVGSTQHRHFGSVQLMTLLGAWRARDPATLDGDACSIGETICPLAHQSCWSEHRKHIHRSH